MDSRIYSARTLQRHAIRRTHALIGSAVEFSSEGIPLETDPSAANEDFEHIHDVVDEHCTHDDNVPMPAANAQVAFDENESSDSEADAGGSECDAEEPVSFQDQLKEWILNSGTPMCHTNSLLALLKPHFPSLPKDARTLLATPLSYELNNIAGGKYHHFGIAKSIIRRLERNNDILYI
jgi:hypothetical protein